MNSVPKWNGIVQETHFTRIFESFGVTGADRLAIDFLVNRLVNLFAFRVVDDWHADVLQPCWNWTFYIEERISWKQQFCPVINKNLIHFRRVFPIRRRMTGHHRIPYPCPANRWATYSIGMQRAEWQVSTGQYRFAACEYWTVGVGRVGPDFRSIYLRRWRNRCHPCEPTGFPVERWCQFDQVSE